MWHTLRKGAVGLHVAWQGDSSNNLTAEHVRVRVAQHCDIALDLSKNLRTRNKQENSYIDARELADGGVERLTLVQVLDERVVEDVLRRWRAATPRPEGWRLLVGLEGTHWFAVDPDRRSTHLDLFLKVRSVIRNADPE